MSLTICYDRIDEADFAYLRNNLSKYEANFFRVGDSLTVEVKGEMDIMLAVLSITSKFRHRSLVLR